jgi:hypothetical protein
MPGCLIRQPRRYLSVVKHLTCVAGLLSLIACDPGFTVGGNDGGTGGGSGGGGTNGGTGGGASMCGIPAQIDAMLNANCRSCHGTVLSSLAPIHLVTYDDLIADSPQYPGTKEAARALARIQDMTTPMPPGLPGVVSASDIAALQSWVNGGEPKSTDCTPADAGMDPINAGSTCTSGAYYTVGDGLSMEPGNACIACHAMYVGAPTYFVAGTVYPSGHEPSRCYGANVSGAQIVITGADGATETASVNLYGNFYTRYTVPAPFHVKLTYQGKERVMVDPPPSGDCNSCHTQDGAMNAPGRITLPWP